MADSQRLVLRIIAGPNAGAEAVLGRRTVIGSAESADIVLADPAVAPAQFTVLVEGTTISLEVGESPVVIRSEPRSGGKFRLAPFDVIKCGVTCCAVGPEKGEWPAYAPADLVPGMTTPATAAAASMPAAGSAPAPKEKKAVPATSAATRPAEVAVRQAAWLPRRRVWVTAAAATAALIVLAVGVRLFLVVPAASKPAQDPRAIAEDIISTLKTMGVTVTPDGKGGMIVGGFVDTNETQRRLRQVLRDANLGFTYRVVSLEQQVTAMRTIIAEAGAHLAVAADPASGRIILSGYVPQAANLETLERIFRRDIADLRPIDARVATLASIAADTRERLDAAGVDGKARVDVAGSGIRIAGALHDDDRAKVRQLVDELNAHWLQTVRIEDATTLATPTLISMPKPVEVPVTRVVPPRAAEGQRFPVIVAGNGAFVRDQYGRRYRVGDKLANGEVIEDINVDGIVTSRDGVTLRHHFGE